MDAPHIQYVKTIDGVSIAFWTLGEGPPLVVLPNLLASNVEPEWEADDRRTAFERLAQRATVIRYDWRGMGLSQRERLDSSVEAASLDLDAVVDRLALDRFALYGTQFSADVAFSLAGSHAGRLSHLIFGSRTPTIAAWPRLSRSLNKTGSCSRRSLRGSSWDGTAL